MKNITKMGMVTVLIVALAAIVAVVNLQPSNVPVTAPTTTTAGPTQNLASLAQAKQALLSYAQTSFPSASASVLFVNLSKFSNTSWNIQVLVAINGTKPCPTVFVEGFDYPVKGLNATSNTTYAKGCAVYGISTAPAYVQFLPVLGVAESYAANTSAIRNFVNKFGYKNVSVSAAYYYSLNALDGHAYSQVWQANYTAPNAGYDQYIVLNLTGRPLSTFTSK